jgi:hypothetical protein
LIGVMLATGQALEGAADRRATKDLRSLLERAPKEARRRTGDAVVTVPLDAVAVDDILVVGPGEMLPVDAKIASSWAVLDESALTGGIRSRRAPDGAGSPQWHDQRRRAIEIRATASADDSTYAGIVRLAREAAATSAPVVRLADRLAQWFLPLTLLVAGTAWLWSGSAERAVAVFGRDAVSAIARGARRDRVGLVPGLTSGRDRPRWPAHWRTSGAQPHWCSTRPDSDERPTTGHRYRGGHRMVASKCCASQPRPTSTPARVGEGDRCRGNQTSLPLSLPIDAIEEPGKGISPPSTADGSSWATSRFPRTRPRGQPQRSLARRSTPPSWLGSTWTPNWWARSCWRILYAPTRHEPSGDCAPQESPDWSC